MFLVMGTSWLRSRVVAVPWGVTRSEWQWGCPMIRSVVADIVNVCAVAVRVVILTMLQGHDGWLFLRKKMPCSPPEGGVTTWVVAFAVEVVAVVEVFRLSGAVSVVVLH